MANDVKLQEGHPVDENLRPIKVGGKATALETAQHGNGARINGDLSLTGRKGKDTLDIHKYHTDATATTLKAVNLNLIRAGNVSSGTDSSTGIDVDVTHIGASGGTIISTGLDIDVVGDAGATTNQAIGTDINVSGADVATGLKIDVDAGTSSKASGIYIDCEDGGTDFKNVSSANSGDIFTINTIEDGETTLTTVESGGGSTAHLNLDADGDITLNSASGNFIAEKAGTEFSVANSAYAGMILGYTEMAYGTAYGRYDPTTSFVVINDNYDHGDGAEDHFLGVTFKVPPSNRVEIEVHLPYVQSPDGTFSLGLATDTSATSLKSKFEVVAWDVDESDTIQVVKKWVIDGSDSGMTGGAWSAGESKTLYCMTKEGTAGSRILWGDAFANYGDMTMKAIALPATIGDGT